MTKEKKIVDASRDEKEIEDYLQSLEKSDSSTDGKEAAVQPTEETSGSRTRGNRLKRRKTYERVSETHIPEDVKAEFKKDDYELRWVRWSINGEEDYRYLARRENEGYEFVQTKELPDSFLAGLRVQDTRNRKGLVTSGDVCLMKVDVDLRESRRDFYNKETDAEVAAADIYTVSKRKGFIDLGSSSKVSSKEPRFQ